MEQPNLESTLKVLADHSPQMHFEIGIALSEDGNFNQAVESLKRSIASDPEFAEAYFKVADVLDEMNKREEVKKWM